MSIDIAAEVKFSRVTVSEGEYFVRLQDAEGTIIGKVIRDGAGWIPQYLDGYFENHTTFATRYMAARPVLEAYELANGLRDAEGRRVTKELETGLWFVANHYGGRESSRWTDKAEAIAHLASLQPGAKVEGLTVYKLVTQHMHWTQVQHFPTFDAAFAAGQATDPEKDGSMLPNISDDVLAEFGGTDEASGYQRGLFWLHNNRYGVIYRKELTGAAAKAYKQVFEFEEIGRQAALNDEPAAPGVNIQVMAALEDRAVGDPVNARVMEAFSRGYQSVRDQQARHTLGLDG